MAESKSSALTRRSFLKATAMTAGAAAVMGTAGCSTVAEQPEEAAEQVNSVEEKTFTNWCRGNCGGPCNLTGVVREGKLVKTTPTILPRSKAPYRKGCVRGHSGPQRIYGTNRLLYPMLQKGERGSDNWERISWDEALDMVAEKFKTAEAEFGPRSVAFAIGCGNSTGLMNGYLTRYGVYENLMTAYGPGPFLRRAGYTEFLYSSDSTSAYMTTNVMASPQNPIEDVKNSKAVFLWGKNIPESGPYAWSFVCDARANGTKIVCIDPQYSKTAAGSDIWVPLRPGTDGALLLAMCNYLIDNDRIDYDYLRNGSVAPLLVKEDGTYLRLSDLGMDPVEVTNSLTGQVTPTDTEVVYDEATGEFGSSFEIKDPALTGTFEVNGIKVSPVYGYVVENIKPFTAEWAAEECGISVDLVNELSQLYADNKPVKNIVHCGWEHLANTWRNYFSIAFLASLAGDAVCSGGGYNYGYLMANSIIKKPVNYNMGFRDAIADEEINFGMTLEYLPQIMETGKWNGEDYPIKVLYVMQENILGSQMGPTYMKEAFKKLDFIVVADPLMTYTTKYADLILPITLSWEDEDFERSAPFMMHKAVEPLGECRSDYDVLKALSERMGFEGIYEKTKEEALREILDTPENIEAGVAYDDYKEKGTIFADGVEGGASAALDTWDDGACEPLEGKPVNEYNPTGRTQFYVERLIPNNDFGQVFEMSDRMPSYEHAGEAYKDNPLREKYPLFCLNGYHNHYFGQTYLSNIPWLDELRGFEGEPYMLIHPKRAEERGIETGDMVKVFNDHGYVVCKAVLSTGLQEETIRLPHGYNMDQYVEGNPQDLVPIILDPVTGNNNYNDLLCEVEKM